MEGQKAEDKKENEIQWWPLVVLFLGIFLLWAVSGILMLVFIGDEIARGTFGDSFGSINALFSGLALAGVIYTILLQRKELRLNTIELGRSADAQEKSEKAICNQSEILRKTLIYQAFYTFTNEYQEAHMLQAVRRLWDFYRLEGDENIVTAYLVKMEEDSKLVSSAPVEERIKLEAASLHYQRRIVSQFYLRISTFIYEKVIPEHIFYNGWTTTDLEIIPKILIPLENGIRTMPSGTGLPELDDQSLLMQLYLKSKTYRKTA